MWTDFLVRVAAVPSTLSALLPEYHVILPNLLLMLGALLITKCVQRSYLTPLWKVPGPLLNSFTNLPLNLYIACGAYHQYTERLHSKYGPVVRIGYSQVSVSDLSELKRILSTHNFPKGSLYKAMSALAPSIFSTTDPNLNKTRRIQLGNSYSLPSVRLYEDKVLKHGVLSLISLWDSRIASSPSQNRTLANFHYCFHGMAFDIIGVLGFGKSFDILSTGDTKMIDSVAKHIKLSTFRSRIAFGKHIQWLFRDWDRARKYVLTAISDALKKRKKENAESANIGGNDGGSNHVDLLQRLVNARDPLTGEPIDNESLMAEISVLLIGGTDTTSNTLDWVVLCLLGRPDVYERLKREIRAEFSDKSTIIGFDMARIKLPYLTAIIYEAMRLHPAVAGYLPRCVREEGAHLMDGRYFLPQGTEIGISFFACHRNEKTWRNPGEFDPDRFMGSDSEERIKDVLVFSSGVRICAGRHLAMAELYTTLANLILRYDFKLPDGKECQHSSVGQLPGKAFFNYAPKAPKKDCWMVVSPA